LNRFLLLLAAALMPTTAHAGELLVGLELEAVGWWGTADVGPIYVGTAVEEGPPSLDGEVNCAVSLARPAKPTPGGGILWGMGVGLPLVEAPHTRLEGWLRIGLGVGWTQGGGCWLRHRFQGEYMEIVAIDSSAALRWSYDAFFTEVSVRGIGMYFEQPWRGFDSQSWLGNGVVGAAGLAFGYAIQTPVGRPELRLGLDVLGPAAIINGPGFAAGVSPRLVLGWAF
jgi:hypothetical protein